MAVSLMTEKIYKLKISTLCVMERLFWTVVVLQIVAVERFLCSDDPGLVYIPVGPITDLLPKSQTQSPVKSENTSTSPAPFGK